MSTKNLLVICGVFLLAFGIWRFTSSNIIFISPSLNVKGDKTIELALKVNSVETYEVDGIVYIKGTHDKYTGAIFHNSLKSLTKIEEINYRNGLRNGKSIKWDDLGNKFLEVIYRDNKLVKMEYFFYIDQDVLYVKNTKTKYTGSITVYSVDLINKIEEHNFKDGLLNGLSLFYDEKGVTIKELKYQDGIFIGDKKLKELMPMYDLANHLYINYKFEFTDDELIRINEKKIELTFNANSNHGILKCYYRNGNKSFEVPIMNGKRNGKALGWHDNGKIKEELKYIDGKPNGKYIAWYDNEKKSEEMDYSEGEVNGLAKSWHNNGQIKDEVKYIGGKRNGKYIGWHDNGEKSEEMEYANGVENGVAKGWHENGKIKYELNYIDGKRNGKYIFWYSNGIKAIETNYLSGKKNGKCISWYENGKKSYESEFVNGSDSLESQSWDDTGALINKSKYYEYCVIRYLRIFIDIQKEYFFKNGTFGNSWKLNSENYKLVDFPETIGCDYMFFPWDKIKPTKEFYAICISSLGDESYILTNTGIIRKGNIEKETLPSSQETIDKINSLPEVK